MPRTKEKAPKAQPKAAKVVSDGKRKDAKKKNDEKKEDVIPDFYSVENPVRSTLNSPQRRFLEVAVGQVWARNGDSTRKITITGLLKNRRVSYKGDANYNLVQNQCQQSFEAPKLNLNYLVRNYTLEQNVKSKIHLIFQHLSMQAHKVRVDPDSIIGDVVKQVPFLEDVKAFIVAGSDGGPQTYFGYDYNLSKPFSAYPEVFRGEVKIWSAGPLNPHTAQWKLKYPLMYFNRKLAWPPENAVNWDEGDPINLAPFLIWHDWGRGSIDPPASHDDNRWQFLAVIKYPNGTAKVVNYVAWTKAATINKRDPLTNQLLDRFWLDEEVSKVATNECWTNSPLPVLTLQYQLCVNDYVRAKNWVGVITAVHTFEDTDEYDIEWCQRRWETHLEKSKNMQRFLIVPYTVPKFEVGDPVRDLDYIASKTGTIRAKNTHGSKVTYDVCWNFYKTTLVAMERNVDPAILEPDPDPPVKVVSGTPVYSHFEIGEGIEKVERGLHGELKYGVIDGVRAQCKAGVLMECYSMKWLHPGASLGGEGGLTPKQLRRYNGNVWEVHDHPYEVGDDMLGRHGEEGQITRVVGNGEYDVHWHTVPNSLPTISKYINHHDLKLNGKNHSFDAPLVRPYDVGQEVVNIQNGRRGKVVKRNALATGLYLSDTTYEVQWINAEFPEKNVSHVVLAHQTKYYWTKWAKGRRVRYNVPLVWNDYSTDVNNPVGTITDVGPHIGTKVKMIWDEGGRSMTWNVYDRSRLWLLPL